MSVPVAEPPSRGAQSLVGGTHQYDVLYEVKRMGVMDT